MHGKTGEAPTRWGKLRVSGQHPILIGLLFVTFAILASAAIVAPFYYSNPNGSPPGEIRFAHDIAIHRSVMEHFDGMLRSGNFYPRWLSDVNYGYGNAWPNFYQPGFYFLTSLVNAVTDNWTDTLFVITALGLAASGLAFYILARVFFGKLASAVAASVYAFLPYHLLDVFWRGAMPEYLSFVLTPLIFYFFFKLGRKGSARDLAGLALGYGVCLMIHVPIAYLFSYLLVFYALAWAAAERDWRIAGRIGVGMTVGALLSAIYWLPAVTEIKYATETVTQLFAYHTNYITQVQGEPVYDHLLRETFALQAIAFLVVVAVWRLLEWREGRNLTRAQAGSGTGLSHTSGWMFMGLLALFMNLEQSYYLARLIPKIEIVAFPWRWLVFVCLFTSLLTAAIVERVARLVARSANGNWVYLVASVATIAVLAPNIWFAAQSILVRSLENPMFMPSAEFLSDTYCPKGAVPAASLPRTERIVVESRTGSSEVIQWAPLYRQAVITTDEVTTARFKTFNFPGWTARVDGADAQISSDPVGAQLIRVPQGRHTVEIRFANTLARSLGAASSVAGVFLVSVLTLAGRRWPGRRGRPLGASACNERTSGEGFALTAAGRPEVSPSESTANCEAHEASTRKIVVRQIAKVSLFGIVLAGGVFSTLMLINELSITDKRDEAYNKPMRGAIGVGTDAKLSFGASNVVTVAADERCLGEVIDAVSRRDDRKSEDLLQSGRAFTVERDAKVRVLGLAGGKARVEILEGAAASKEGWVLEGWLK